MDGTYPHIPNSTVRQSPCQRLHFVVSCLRVQTAVPPSCHTWHLRDFAAHLERRPGGWGRHSRGDPPREPLPAHALCSWAAPPRPRPPSGWNLNLRRDPARSLEPWLRHGEPRLHRALPGATAACSLGTETCLHRSGAAGDRAALPRTTGPCGHGGARRGCGRVSDLASDFCSFWLHLDVDFLLRQTEKTVFVPFTVLPGDPESQGDTTTTRASGPVWELGANLCRQPVSGSGAA